MKEKNTNLVIFFPLLENFRLIVLHPLTLIDGAGRNQTKVSSTSDY